MTALVWYRDDLRVSDHFALHAAAKSHASVAFVYVLDDRAPGIRPLGGAARWWLAQSLRADLSDAALFLARGPGRE